MQKENLNKKDQKILDKIRKLTLHVNAERDSVEERLNNYQFAKYLSMEDCERFFLTYICKEIKHLKQLNDYSIWLI